MVTDLRLGLLPPLTSGKPQALRFLSIPKQPNESFPAAKPANTIRYVCERNAVDKRTQVTLSTGLGGRVTVLVGHPPKGHAPRSFLVRLHLAAGQEVSGLSLGGQPVTDYRRLRATSGRAPFPFGGVGTPPAAAGGDIVEVQLPPRASGHRFEALMR